MTPSTANEIRQHLELAIRNGEYAAGDQLPAVRKLADELGVSPTTAAAAYRRLRERGLAVGKGRRGTRVADRGAAPTSTAAAASRPAIPSGTTDAMTGNPDRRLLPDLAAAVADALATNTLTANALTTNALDGDTDQPVYGGPLIDDRLADAGRRNLSADHIDSTHLAVTSGAIDAVQRVIASLDLKPGCRIGVEDPGHVPVHNLARSAGLEAVPLPVDDSGVTPEGLENALKRGIDALVVTPRAHNPTGAAFTSERAKQVSAALAPHPGVAVVVDDNASAVAGADYVGLQAPGDRWAVIRSFGKFLGPDLRVGIMAGDAHTVTRVNDSISDGPGWVSHLLQRTVAKLLTDPAITESVVGAARSYAERRLGLIAKLASHGVTATGRSGLNVWIPIHDEQATIEVARAAGYAIRAGAPYRIDSPPAVRVTVSALDDADLDRFAHALGEATTARPPPPV